MLSLSTIFIEARYRRVIRIRLSLILILFILGFLSFDIGFLRPAIYFLNSLELHPLIFIIAGFCIMNVIIMMIFKDIRFIR